MSMQTRDYDDTIYIPSLRGFRQLNNQHTGIFLEEETDRYSTLYPKPKESLGFISINILKHCFDDCCNAEYTFVDYRGKKIKILLHKSNVVKS